MRNLNTCLRAGVRATIALCALVAAGCASGDRAPASSVEDRSPRRPALLRPSSQAADLLIHGATVVTMDSERRVLEGASVVVRGGKIAAVLKAGEPLPKAREVVHAAGHLVIPGLVNTHGHVPMVLFRGLADDMALMEWLNDFIFPAEAATVDRDFSYWGTLLAGIEMARSGTTTFSDMYYFEDSVARATDELGLRAVLGQTVIGFKAPDYATPEEAIAGTEAFVKEWKGHERITPAIAPHALYTTSLETVRQCAELARRLDVPFQMHANESAAEDAEVRKRHGATSVGVLRREELLFAKTQLHHGITLTPEDRAALAAAGASISHNPESNMKGASGMADLQALLDAGLSVGLGTDGGAGNNNLDLFEEMDTCAKVHKLIAGSPTAMPAKRVFELATIGGARALGLGEQVGSIEVGKLADLVLIDVREPELTPLYDVYSQLVYAIKGGHVRTVVVHGRVIVRNREALTVDVERVIEQAKRIQVRVREAVEERRRAKDQPAKDKQE